MTGEISNIPAKNPSWLDAHEELVALLLGSGMPLYNSQSIRPLFNLIRIRQQRHCLYLDNIYEYTMFKMPSNVQSFHQMDSILTSECKFRANASNLRESEK